jgi:amino acid adenylation domain-containing protein
MQVSAVSVDDDFFALGGHSLSAMQLIARVQAKTGVSLPIATVFQNPVIEDLARDLTSLLENAQKSTDASVPATLEHRLSRSQRRLWFLDQLDPGNSTYNIVVALELRGDLDGVAFSKTMTFLVERHEALRTVFEQGPDGEPLARVQDGRNWDISTVTLPASVVENRDDLFAVLKQEADRSFLLDTGPLFRVTLYRLAEREHIALLAMHHIISDGWSVGVLARELGIVYDAFLHMRPMPLPPLKHQFRDFVRWESTEIAASEEQDARYWKDQLAGELPVLDLPTDLPRPAVQTFRGARLSMSVSRDLVERLERLAREQHATLFMVLIAAFDVLLHQYTGSTDLLIGTPTAGRRNADFEEIFGFFVNNLVLRSDLSGNPTAQELIRRVRSITIDAFEHQGTPFDQLVEILKPERRLDRSPVFQVMFALQNAPLGALRLGALQIKTLDMTDKRARYEIVTEFYPSEGEYRLDFEYNTDLFREDTIIRMQAHFIYLLEAMIADSSRPIKDLPLLNPSERHRILDEWNSAPLAVPAASSVAAWFKAQAHATPANIAIASGAATLSYAELDRVSDALAAALQARGIGRGRVVGLYLQRDIKLVVGLLAILKAGGAYLPLDPALPARRLSYILEDSGVAAVLTEEALQERLGLSPERIVVFETTASAESSTQNIFPFNASTLDDLALMIYTSGSTGNPKGTRISQGALLNLLASILDTPGLSESDTLVAVSTISFDIASLEVLGPLLRGARLVVASAEEVHDPEALAGLLDRTGGTVMQATPATWRMLVDSGWLGRPDLRMWCGGEALTPSLAEALLARGRELWNMYGPTETTIYSTRHRVRSAEDPILIGKPISSTRVYILDEQQQPVAAGVHGELYIAGAGLAQGYWQQPELTAQRFIPDPFSTTGDRMYRTGDIARFRDGGAIQLLGRADQQIKLRGYRIELGEIEAALGGHPSVQQAIVLCAGEGSARHLIAYLLEQQQGDVSPEDLRAWLRERLPEYMVPSRFVSLETLPLTPSGKVDRKRLAAEQPASGGEERASGLMRPRSEVEGQVAKVWSSVLGIESIDVRDNFFDLGGHSLLLVQVHAQLRAEFGTRLSIVDLFRYSTVEAIAARLSQIQQPGLAGGAKT